MKSRWKTGSRELHVDDIVFLKDPEAFNHTWPMARVVKLYPGSDGHVRVVDLSIKGRIYRLPAKHLVLLPIQTASTASSAGEDVRASPH